MNLLVTQCFLRAARGSWCLLSQRLDHLGANPQGIRLNRAAGAVNLGHYSQPTNAPPTVPWFTCNSLSCPLARTNIYCPAPTKEMAGATLVLTASPRETQPCLPSPNSHQS